MCSHSDEDGFILGIPEYDPVGLDSFNMTMNVQVCHSCHRKHKKTQRVSGLVHVPDIQLGKPSGLPLEEIVSPRMQGFKFTFSTEDRYGKPVEMVHINVHGDLRYSGDIVGGYWENVFDIPKDEFLSTPVEAQAQG